MKQPSFTPSFADVFLGRRNLAQNVVEAVKRTGTLDCRDILRFGNHADFTAIPGRVQADVAFVTRRIVEADRAKMHLLIIHGEQCLEML